MLPLLVALAAAQTVSIPIQGVLTDADGRPLNGSFTVTFTLREGSAVRQTQATTLGINAGAFAATLDASAADFRGDGAYTLTATVGGIESAPVAVGWAPRAAHAANAAALGGEPSTAWFRWSDAGTGLTTAAGKLTVSQSWVEGVANAVDDDRLAALACADGDVPMWSQSTTSWVCAQPGYRSASQIVAALAGTTLAVGTLNAGTVGATGNVSGAAVSATGALSGGSLAVTGAASTGALTATSVAAGAISASGGVKVGAVADAACDSAAAGTIRWTGTTFQGCNGVNWVAFGGADGLSASSAASTCKTLKTLLPTTASGTYWIKPPGAATAFQAYCDMTTDGGGWTLQFHMYNHSGMSENAFIGLFGHNLWTNESWRLTPGGSPTSGIGDGVRPLAGQGAVDIDWFTGAWTDVRMTCNASNNASTVQHFAQVDNYTTTNSSFKLLGGRANGASYSVTAAKNSFNQSTIWHDNETTTGNSGHYFCDTYQAGTAAAQFGFCYTDFLNNPNTLDYGDSIVALAFGTEYGNDTWSAGFSGECGNMGQSYLSDVGTWSIWIR